MKGLFVGVGHGWASLSFGSFEGYASLLTNPMEDMGKALLAGAGVVRCDEEGNSFDIVVTEYGVYVVSHRDKSRLHTTELSIGDLARMFVEEVELRLYEWSKWDVFECDLSIYEEKVDKKRGELVKLSECVAKKYGVVANYSLMQSKYEADKQAEARYKDEDFEK